MYISDVAKAHKSLEATCKNSPGSPIVIPPPFQHLVKNKASTKINVYSVEDRINDDII